MLAVYWLPTVVVTLRCCQHRSTQHGRCGEDDTEERRSRDLSLYTMDCVWLLFTPELSCVDTKWLTVAILADSEKSRREAVCYRADIGTQPLRVITQKTHSHQTNCLIPGLPLSPLLLSPTSFETCQKVTSLDLLASVLEWVWKKFRFWKRRESPFVWTDKVWGVKRKLLWKCARRIFFH